MQMFRYCFYWLSYYRSLSEGSASHKDMKKISNPIMRAYYTSRVYILQLQKTRNYRSSYLYFAWLMKPAFWDFTVPISAHNQVIEYKLISAVKLSIPVSFWKYFIAASLPLCIGKQIINVVQLVGASVALAKLDLDDLIQRQK